MVLVGGGGGEMATGKKLKLIQGWGIKFKKEEGKWGKLHQKQGKNALKSHLFGL